jgi:alkylation response protein AidB-like acyl-CoA dehydrogenase
METTAEEVDGGFIINGSKTWISNAPVAYVLILFLESLEYNASAYHSLEMSLLYGQIASGITRFVVSSLKRFAMNFNFYLT